MTWVGIDLDGTLAKYPKAPNWTIGEPIPLMVDRVKEWIAEGKEVRIFTARVHIDPTGEYAQEIAAWCKEHIGQELPSTCIKDFGCCEIWDDIAVHVGRDTGIVNR